MHGLLLKTVRRARKMLKGGLWFSHQSPRYNMSHNTVALNVRALWKDSVSKEIILKIKLSWISLFSTHGFLNINIWKSLILHSKTPNSLNVGCNLLRPNTISLVTSYVDSCALLKRRICRICITLTVHRYLSVKFWTPFLIME